ncbi:MAG: LPXTG cell wall anchor domain-containing protein, partial [Firmicutes bacterium]|nr:LPXTG cell wall anchor domain-containing protein [Bacillota bacterium]
LIKDPVTVTVLATNALTVEVPNASGVELPSTGGIGTTIFYVLGAALVIGAGVLLVTRRRMDKNN